MRLNPFLSHPTPIPTLVPTAIQVSPTQRPSQTPTDAPPTLTPTSVALTCNAIFENLYTRATNACLNKPDGYFCNGGSPPIAEPAGPISSAIGGEGAVVEAQLISSLRTQGIPTNNSGGLIWFRLHEFVQLNALLIGDVQLTDITVDEEGLPSWQAFVVQTYPHETVCNTAPSSSFVVQSDYGLSSRLGINGVGIDLDGTLVIQTHGLDTHFIVIEGQARIGVFGQPFTVFAGQQLVVTYNAGDFNAPAGLPGPPIPLESQHVENLPTVLFDRSVRIPQPGFIATEGRVNMRAEPSVSSQLLYQVPADQIMTVLGMNPDRTWFHVQLGNGETGWMRADLLSQNLGRISATYDATPIPPQRYGEFAENATVIVGQGGNLREAPDVAFKVITTLPYGTPVKLLARSPYSPFVKVEVDGQEGWLALITLETESVINSLPVDYGVPLPPRPTAAPVFSFGGGHAYPDPNAGN